MRRFRAELFQAVASRWSLMFLGGAVLAALFGAAGRSPVAWNALILFSMLFVISVFWQYAQRKAHWRDGRGGGRA